MGIFQWRTSKTLSAGATSRVELQNGHEDRTRFAAPLNWCK